MMIGPLIVAFAASVGNLVQGWDAATIAGAIMYIKKDFHLEDQPTIEGLILAMSLIGGTSITMFAGPIADSIGRRPMLMISAMCYLISSLVMLWSPSILVLLMARLVDGFGIGISIAVIPIYISETAPSEIRGLLNTFPQLCCSGGMFLSYCVLFGMSLMEAPSWRVMLGLLLIPSILYLILIVLFVPESPRWLVSLGQMHEAREVLKQLRGREDVSGEMALLVEGLDVGQETSIEEYIITPANDYGDDLEAKRKNEIRLYGAEEGVSWVAKPVKAGQSALAVASRQGSMTNVGPTIMDPLVTLFGSVHEKYPPDSIANSRSSIAFPNVASLVSLGGQPKQDQSDMDSHRDGDDSSSDSDEDMRSPLLSRQGTEKDTPQPSGGSVFQRNSSLTGEPENVIGIGGGWQLAYKYSEKVGEDGKIVGGVQRMYLHQEGGLASRGSLYSLSTNDFPEEGIQAAALVSQSALCSSVCPGGKRGIMPPQVPPPEAVPKGPSWKEILEPGARRALFVGVGMQILQQLSGLNGVMFYTPQILNQAGVTVLFSSLGLSSAAASILTSGLTTLAMLPCILLSMRLMDIAGRRYLMLATIPLPIGGLLALVVGNAFNIGATASAILSTAGLVVYLSCFVMGFGAIPNIVCSEIFPTRVRGLGIALCALTYWTGNIIVTYSLPTLLNSIGLAGVFSIYAVMCTVSWFFIYMKVPETKGMPLEVISEFFAVGAKQADAATAFR